MRDVRVAGTGKVCLTTLQLHPLLKVKFGGVYVKRRGPKPEDLKLVSATGFFIGVPFSLLTFLAVFRTSRSYRPTLPRS